MSEQNKPDPEWESKSSLYEERPSLNCTIFYSNRLIIRQFFSHILFFFESILNFSVLKVEIEP